MLKTSFLIFCPPKIKPLTKEEILERVKKQRFIKENTVFNEFRQQKIFYPR